MRIRDCLKSVSQRLVSARASSLRSSGSVDGGCGRGAARAAHQQLRPVGSFRGHEGEVVGTDAVVGDDQVEHITCHRLRHCFATEMARAGMPVPALMKLLGHTTPKMTMRYVEVAQADVRQAYDQALTQLSVIRSVQSRTMPVSS